MYYGWVVVGALMVVAVVSVALAGPIMSFFIPAMHEDLGIPLAYFGIAMSTRQLSFAMVSPILGRWIDRYGARPLLLGVAVIAGALTYALSYVEQGWHLIAIVGLLGFVGLQGAGGELYASVAVAKWFEAQRGRAMAIAFIGTPVGIFFLTPLTQHWIDTVGWQTAWQYLAWGGGLLLVVAALFIRRPDGKSQHQPQTRQSTNTPVYQWRRDQAIRSPTFWRVSIGFGILMFTISTVAMFRVQHFFDRGLDPQWVAYAFSAEAVVSACAAIPVGLLIERYPIHKLTAIGYSFAILMLLLTINTNGLLMLFLATGCFGLGAASVIILQNNIWPQYFGSLHIGAIRGVAMPVTLGFAILGAPVAGWVRDATGSFTPIWWATIVAMLLAMALIFFTPKPQPPTQ